MSAGIDGTLCVIEVIDRGGGFDGSTKGLADAEPRAEDGRGIQLMRALVDKVTFTSRPQVGTVVHLEKQLDLGRRRGHQEAHRGPAADRARPVVAGRAPRGHARAGLSPPVGWRA